MKQNNRSQNKIPYTTKNSITNNYKNKEYSDDKLDNLYNNLLKLITRIDEVENFSKLLEKQIEENKNKENKLLNRFSWLIVILSVGSSLIFIMAFVLFWDTLYPFIKKLMSTSKGLEVIITIVGGGIGTGIFAVWLTFNKYVKFIIKRENE